MLVDQRLQLMQSGSESIYVEADNFHCDSFWLTWD
ncbi:Uncharacterised protein [Vibrio cholerae]|nr:Uncharacterised protein [Vibrio cholerae]